MTRTKPNKSAAIREQLKKTPNATAPEVVKALAAEGIKVSPVLVYNVRNRIERKGTTGKKRGRPSKDGTVSVESLLQAKAFAERSGGIEAARGALEALSKLS